MNPNFQPRNGAGPVEALLRRAALRQVGNRTRGELAVDGRGVLIHPSHTAARRWSVLGALMAERELKCVPGQETLQRELGKPITLLVESVFGLRQFVDWTQYTVVDVLSVLNNWASDEELELWWERAIKGARENGV